MIDECEGIRVCVIAYVIWNEGVAVNVMRGKVTPPQIR